MMQTLSSQVASEVVTTTPGATSDEKVDIITTVGFHLKDFYIMQQGKSLPTNPHTVYIPGPEIDFEYLVFHSFRPTFVLPVVQILHFAISLTARYHGLTFLVCTIASRGVGESIL